MEPLAVFDRHTRSMLRSNRRRQSDVPPLWHHARSFRCSAIRQCEYCANSDTFLGWLCWRLSRVWRSPGYL